MNIDDKKIRAAFLEHYSISDWVTPVAVTLTFRMGISTLNGIQYGTDERYSQNLKHALNVMNRKLFGRRFREHGRRLKVIPVLETDQSGRRHYHLALDLVDRIDIDSFRKIIASTWGRTDWGYHEIDVQPADSGWIAYIMKGRGKPDVMSAVDWDNLHY